MLYNSGIVKWQGVEVGNYSQPFNVDVVKEEYQDPYFQNTVLYLKGDTLTDSSGFSRSLSIIGNPAPAIIDGRTGIYFGGDGDRIDIPYSSDLYFGSGDFTLEAWIRPTGSTGGNNNFDQSIYGNLVNGSFYFYLGYQVNNFAIWDGSNWVGNTEMAILSQWYHVAFSRVSGVVKLFLNGSSIASQSYPYSDAGSDARSIGSTPSSQRHGRFYLSEFKITKGVGRYSTNFVPLATFSGYNYRTLVWR